MMMRTFLRGSLAALALTVGGGVSTSMAQQSTGAQLNYEGAELAQVARDVSFRTGRVFVLDPRLSGRVTIVSPPNANLSSDIIWEMFLATLQMNGFAAVPIGEREYKIVPSAQAIRDGRVLGEAPAGGATVTRVIQLRYVSAASAASTLRGLGSETSLVTPIVESNSLILVDTADNVSRLMSVIADIDVDKSIVRTVPLENAAASQVAATLRELVAGRGSADQAGAISVVAIDATNSLMLRGDPAEIQRLIPIMQELDTAITAQSALDTIYLDHADAEELVPIIQQLLNESVSAPAAEDVRSSAVAASSVAFHKATNALIVNGSPDTQRMVRSIVNRLDIRRPQVQIEAVVVEISNNTARELGVQYVSGGGNVPLSAASFGNTSPNVVSAAGAALFLTEEPETQTVTQVIDGVSTTTEQEVFDQNDPTVAIANQLVEAAVGELLSFDGFLIGAGDRNSDGSVYGVLLSAIQSDSQSNVMQVPSTTLLDNETSTLQVGQEIPIVTGEAVGSDFQGGFRQIERKDVGTILEVTPQINAGNTVQLDISLEISSIGAFSALSQEIITNKSLIETVALAEDGQTLVIGGLIDNNRVDTESKVPLLGDIPIMGNLFKGQSRSEEKSTLMVFIRPTILRDDLASDSVTARKYDYVRQEQLRRDKDGVARIDEIMRDYIGHDAGFVPPPQGDTEERVIGEDATLEVAPDSE